MRYEVIYVRDFLRFGYWVDDILLIPVSEVTSKGEFFNIKNVTRDDLLAAHRISPQLMGIVPSDTGRFGAADTAAEVFGRNEIEPSQR